MLFGLIEQEFSPPSPSRQMNLSVSVPSTFEMADIRAVFDQAEQVLLSRKETLEIATISSDINSRGGRLSIYFEDLSKSQVSTTELTSQIREVMPQIAGVGFNVGRRFGTGGGQSGVSVQLRGPDSAVLQIYADDIAGQLASVTGLLDVSNLEAGDEKMQVRVNRDQANAYGISPNAVAQSISTALSDSTSANFRSAAGEVPIRVAVGQSDPSDMQRIENLTVSGQNGLVPVGALVELSTAFGPISIQRENGDQILSVSDNTDRRGLVALQQEINRSMQEVQLPPGYSWQMGSNFRAFRESQSTSLFAVVLAVIFVFIIMASLFESFLHPITILFSVPFSLIGVSAVFYLTRTTLLGLMPAVAPIVLPQVVGPTEGRASQYGPIALALVGGLTASTFLTLVITPTIYSLMDDLSVFMRRAAHGVRTSTSS